MSTLLSFESPLEYMLRYNVILGAIIITFGLVFIFLAKHITCAVRKTDQVDNNDKLLQGLRITGIVLFVIGFIVAFALDINRTFYKG